MEFTAFLLSNHFTWIFTAEQSRLVYLHLYFLLHVPPSIVHPPITTLQLCPVAWVPPLKISDNCVYIWLIHDHIVRSRHFLHGSLFLGASVHWFVSLSHPRGRTRGRVVVDEEDSMDGTEITESIGSQDTGETLQSHFCDPLYTHSFFWEWYKTWTCTSRQ